MKKASVISAMISAGSSAKPEMKMKPKPRMISIAPRSTGPLPRLLNSGNMIALTMIIPATRQAARKAKAITKSRPISAMIRGNRHCERSEAIQTFFAGTTTGLLRRGACHRAALRADPSAPRDDETASTYASSHSIRHRHRAQRLPLACRQFLGLRLQLTAGGEDVAAARRAHRRGIAGVEDVFGELLDLLPVRALI